MRSIFWSVFSRIRTEYGEILRISVFSPNPGKYGPEKTPYLDTFHTVILILSKGVWDLHNFVCDIVKLFEKIEPKVFRFIGPGNELVKKQLNLMDSTCLKSLKRPPNNSVGKFLTIILDYSLQDSTKRKIFRSVHEK